MAKQQPKVQLVAVAPKMDPTIKRRKKMSANFGVASAATGLAALGTKGGAIAGKPSYKIAGKRIIPKIAKQTRGKMNKTAISLGTASGVLAGIGGGNAALVQRAELDQKTPPIKILNRRMPGVNSSLKKQKVSKKDIRASRERRNKTYPYAAAGGAGAAGAGAAGVGGVRLAARHQDKKATRFTNAANVSNLIGQERFSRTKDGAKPYKYQALQNRAVKEANFMGNQTMKLKGQAAKHTAKGVKLRRIGNKKVGFALAGASAGLAGVSAITNRNNKRGFTKHRQDWWNG